MRSDRLALWLAAVSVGAVATVAVWGFSVDPDAYLRWVIVGAFLPVLWGFLEVAQVRGENPATASAIATVHRYCMAWAGWMICLRIGVQLAVNAEMLDTVWLSHGRRLSGLVLGAGLLLFGNTLPTLRSPWAPGAAPFAWQQVHRFVGWVFVLAGLGVLGSWVLLPIESATRWSFLISAAACSIALSRKLASLMAHWTPRGLVQ